MDQNEQLFSPTEEAFPPRVPLNTTLDERLAQAFQVTPKQVLGLSDQFRDSLVNFKMKNSRGMTEVEWYQFLKGHVQTGLVDFTTESDRPIF
jgi:hypothetical protein